METREVWIPSKERAENMPKIKGMFPDAIICVHESEYDDYKNCGLKVETHDLDKLNLIRNHIIEKCQADCLFTLDDDLKCVWNNIGKSRFRKTDPDFIWQMIENSHRICEDLDIGVFSWPGMVNLMLLDPNYRPVRFTGLIYGGFGVRGTARTRQWKTEFGPRSDLNFTLETLRDDRICFCDIRFSWDFGLVGTGKGGGTGKYNDLSEVTKRLKDKWGKAVYFDGVVKQANSDTTKATIRCRRSSNKGREWR
jgi:hypothetical protein